jgi:hypothetical protein
MSSALHDWPNHWSKQDGDTWYIVAGGRAKKCRNLATAEAWAKYIVRAAKREGWSETRILNMGMGLWHGPLIEERGGA